MVGLRSPKPTVVAATNTEAGNPLLHGEIQTINTFYDVPKDERPPVADTVFLTTHYIEEAEELADRVGIIDHGKLIAEGTANETGKPTCRSMRVRPAAAEIASGSGLSCVSTRARSNPPSTQRISESRSVTSALGRGGFLGPVSASSLLSRSPAGRESSGGSISRTWRCGPRTDSTRPPSRPWWPARVPNRESSKEEG